MQAHPTITHDSQVQFTFVREMPRGYLQLSKSLMRRTRWSRRFVDALRLTLAIPMPVLHLDLQTLKAQKGINDNL